MADQPIPAHVATFLNDQIDSVVQLEVLLTLHSAPQRAWSAAEIGRELRVDPEWVEAQMKYLAAHGLLSVEARDPHPLYRFAPAAPGLAQTVSDLARAYEQRRVTVISMIYSRPVDPVRHLAEAFRIRGTSQEGPPHG